LRFVRSPVAPKITITQGSAFCPMTGSGAVFGMFYFLGKFPWVS
jgi:hypothetical protein